MQDCSTSPAVDLPVYALPGRTGEEAFTRSYVFDVLGTYLP